MVTKKKLVEKKKKKDIPHDSHMIHVAVEETMTESFGNYAKYVNLERSIPDLRDGLLPVQRRLLFAMHTMGWTNNKPHVKSARPVAETMGKYHPHGDCCRALTRIRLLDGSTKTIEELCNIGEEQEVLAINKDGNIVPAKAHSFRVGQFTDKVYHIKLLNGYEIEVTGNHPFRTLEGNWVKAEDLKPYDIIDFANIRKDSLKNYEYISGYKTNSEYLHKLVFNHFEGREVNKVIHHINDIKDKFEIIDFNDNDEIKTALEEVRDFGETGKSLEFKYTLLRKPFIRAISKHGRLPKREEVVNTSGVSTSVTLFKSDYEMYRVLGNLVPVVMDIYIEEVNQEPMYDFTVDEHENMLIVASDDNSLLASVHNSSIYGAMARMSKSWLLNEICVDMDGNNGSIDGDREAAYRYTESRLSPYAEDILLSNLSMKGIAPMKNNFDDTLQEPEYLPAKLPNILINGSEGIGVAYASNVPTFNVTEVLNGCIAQIKNPDISVEEMMTIIPLPDFPTGGVISGYRGYADIMENGRGTVKVRGKFHIEEDEKTYSIVFTEIPYGSLKPQITKVIDEDIFNKKVAGIIEARDESGRDGLRYTVICKKDADRNAILGYLFTKTNLQINVPINMVVIANGKPRQLGVNSIIKNFNEFRIETFVRGIEIQIEELAHKKHIAEGHLLLVANIEQVVDIIKNSQNKSESKDRLMEAIGFSETQVEVILNMSLHRISKTDSEKYASIVEDCSKGIAGREFILSSDKNIRKQIIKNYQGLIKKYGTPRKTELIEELEDWTFSKVDIIPDEKTVVGVSRQGFIKRSTVRSYKTTENGGNDDLVAIFETTTRKHIILLAENGEYAYIPVFQIPETRWGDSGKHINTLGSELGANEVVFACEHDDDIESQHILVVKTDGIVKLSKAMDYARTRSYFKLMSGVKIKSDEKVLTAYNVDLDEENYLAFVDSHNASMYFDVKDLSVTGLRTAGSLGIRLNKKQGRVIDEIGLYHTKDAIPDVVEYRERGNAGWQHKKEDIVTLKVEEVVELEVDDIEGVEDGEE